MDVAKPATSEMTEARSQERRAQLQLHIWERRVYGLRSSGRSWPIAVMTWPQPRDSTHCTPDLPDAKAGVRIAGKLTIGVTRSNVSSWPSSPMGRCLTTVIHRTVPAPVFESRNTNSRFVMQATGASSLARVERRRFPESGAKRLDRLHHGGPRAPPPP